MTLKKMQAELAKRLKAMERERDALRALVDDAVDQADRMNDACDSIHEAIDRLSEVV